MPSELQDKLRALKATWLDVLEQCKDRTLPGEVDTFTDDLAECVALSFDRREDQSGGPVAWMRLRNDEDLPPVAYSQWEKDQLVERRRFKESDFIPLFAHPPKAEGMSDEEIERILKAEFHMPDIVGTKRQDDAFRDGCAWGLRYARDHALLKPPAPGVDQITETVKDWLGGRECTACDGTGIKDTGRGREHPERPCDQCGGNGTILQGDDDLRARLTALLERK